MSGTRRTNKPKIGYTPEEIRAEVMADAKAYWEDRAKGYSDDQCAKAQKARERARKAKMKLRVKKRTEYQPGLLSEVMPTKPGPGIAPVERRHDSGQEAEFPYGLTRIITDETSSLPPAPPDPTPNTFAQDKAPSPKKAPTKIPFVAFPKIDDLHSSEVEIAFVSDESILIKARGQHKRFTFAEAGFKDRRRGDLPNSRWAVLRDLAESNTNILEDKHGATKTAAHKIRSALKKLVGMEDDPIPYDKKAKRYQLAFRLSDERKGGA